MTGALRIIAAIVRKDVAVLWPLAAIGVLLPVLRSDFIVDALRNDNLRAGTIAISALGTMLLIVGVMHQDASASVRHDWLTRPIPRWTLLTAKLVFIAVIVYVPAIATDFVSSLADGHTVSEAVARATAISPVGLGATMAVVIFAAVTSTLLEAAGALVAFAAMAIVAQALSSSVLHEAKGTLVAGAEWLSFAPALYLPLVLGAPVLWLQYSRRRTSLARAIVAGTCIGALVPVMTPPPAMFRVLKLLSPGPDAGRVGAVALAAGCLSRIATETESGTVTDEVRRLWDDDQRAKTGPGAIAFSTRVTPTGVPRGWKTMIGHAEASYVDADGAILHRLRGSSAVFTRPEGVDASESATHFWLASGNADADAVRRSARLRLNYFVSLLEPVASAQLDMDGQRQFLPAFGYCSIGRNGSHDAASVDCFLRGKRPALVTAKWSGVTDAPEVLTKPDYVPTAFEVFSGAPYRLTLSRVPHVTPRRVALTAYEARSHVEIPVDAPDLPGGPSCQSSAQSTGNAEGEQP